jgi:hypothetical protein
MIRWVAKVPENSRPTLRFMGGHGALWAKGSQICAGYRIFAVSYEGFKLAPRSARATLRRIIERQLRSPDIMELARRILQHRIASS